MTQKNNTSCFVRNCEHISIQDSGEKPKKREAAYWLCVTTVRVLAFAATLADQVLYDHFVEFQQDFVVQVKRGKLSDDYMLRDAARELHLKSVLFRSANLEKALKSHLLTSKDTALKV
jgi:hypothetical protein